MSYDHRDSTALNKATEAGIKCFGAGIVGDSLRQVTLNKIECPCLPDSETPEILLANAIEAFTRIYPDDTLWVEVICDDIPLYVTDAVKSLQGFGCRMIVTHGAKSSHDIGSHLITSLSATVKAANHGGTLWHPIREDFVSAT
jgi:hypothetical protein